MKANVYVVLVVMAARVLGMEEEGRGVRWRSDDGEDDRVLTFTPSYDMKTLHSRGRSPSTFYSGRV